MRRTRVYIAGPIVIGDLATNIKQATDAGMRLLKAGYSPLTPHLSCYYDGPVPAVLPGGTVLADWYEGDLAWVEVADVLLRLPGEGKGSDAEVAHAQKFGIEVYLDIDKLLDEVPTRWADAHKYRRMTPWEQRDYRERLAGAP